MKTKRWILLAAMPAATVALVSIGLGARPGELPADEPPRPVRAMVLQAADEGTEHRFSGRAEAAERTLLAFRVPGQVQAVQVDVGQPVRRGDVLARLDARDYRLKVQELEAMQAAAQARLEQARASHERGRRLVSDEAISQAEFEAIEAIRSEAVGARDAISEALATARGALGDTELRAPFAGFVSARLVEPFELVAPQRPILGLDRADEIEVRVGIPESLIGSRHQFREVQVSFPAVDVAVPGRVKSVGVDVDPGTQTYPVRIAVDNLDHRIVPGMTAEVILRLSWPRSPDTGGFVVPLVAVFDHEGSPHVWIRDAVTGRVHRRAVETGSLERSGIYVRGDLDAGDVVVTAGVHHLRDGQPVRLLADQSSGGQR